MGLDFSLEGKTVLVTGASSGIGRSVCHELADLGANVILLARSVDGMAETMASMPKGKCLALECDLRDLDALHAKIAVAWKWQEGLFGFVHCAGVGGKIVGLREVTPEHVQERMVVHCYAFIEILRAINGLKKKKDELRVVGISSMAATGRYKYMAGYAASKGALETAAMALSKDLVHRNVRINLIRPAYVATPFIVTPFVDGLEEIEKTLVEEDRQPLGLLTPEDVSKMVLYLFSPWAQKITGSVFTLNAGA